VTLELKRTALGLSNLYTSGQYRP